MFLSSMKLVGAHPLPSLQVSKPKQQKTRSTEMVKVSRRDALLSTAAATALVLCPSFITTEPAEARTGRLEAKRKVMEKLEKLKERAKSSKQKTDKDKDFALLVPPIPFPYPQDGAIEPLIEAIVPELESEISPVALSKVQYILSCLPDQCTTL